ncbi:hypothetical protein [Actinotignum urinale]|uniref:hypothetical protein n=1 Tax=Actinotignum urinale TaxID=190146 RepID=UPI0003B608B6|nr:hypothetical protein [Actinotignum urinale]MDY5159563.1 hypothetical protein [Actinotignum urinale]
MFKQRFPLLLRYVDTPAEGGSNSTVDNSAPEQTTDVTETTEAADEKTGGNADKVAELEKAVETANGKIVSLEETHAKAISELETKNSELTTELNSAHLDTERYKAVVEHGLPMDLVEFLNGTDAKTIQAQAKKLAERLAETSRPRAPRPDPNQGTQGKPPVSLGEMFGDSLNKLAR